VKHTESAISTTSPPEVDIQSLRALVAEDMALVDELIQMRLNSEVHLIGKLGHYIVNSGGKRLRPTLLLLISRYFGYSGAQHINLAAIIEFIHTATLLHDDVVDASMLRRGQVTANQRWGNEASVLVGDFVYSRAFQMMVETDSMRVMEILSNATNTIAEGEVQQLLNRHDPETTEVRYLAVIRDKTAKLFEAAGQLAAIICDRPKSEEQAMAAYGRHIGTAFQLIDDALDYSATSSELGKNIGDDLAEGKPTLPLLYAMWPKVLSIGANAHIKSQLNSLNIEKEILTKTISRLYQHEVDLSKIQRDRLLIRYQHQLGIVLAKIEKLEAASKHPDLGPLGDGLITLMDQKLSQLDKRLYELTSKINIANTQIEENKPKTETPAKKVKQEAKNTEAISQIQKDVTKDSVPSDIMQQRPLRPVEITTLTELPSKVSEFPLIEQKPRNVQMEIIQERIDNQQQKVEEKVEVLQTSVDSTNFEKSEIPRQETFPTLIEQKPKPTIKLPEEENIEDDDDDLDRIKGEIMKTLSKLEQAEVE